jgi:hypothetical protein
LSRRKIILATFTLLALISFAGGILIDIYFAQHNPTEPRPAQGQIHPVSSNKVRVYLSNRELIIFYLPGVSFFVWLGAISYFGVRWKLIKMAMKQPKYTFPVARKRKNKNDH